MEETWELAALDMNVLRVISISSALILAACGQDAPAPSAKAQEVTPAAASKAPVQAVRKTPRKNSYDPVRDSNKIQMKVSYADQNSTPRYANISLSCFGDREWLLVLSDGIPEKLLPGEFIRNSGDTKIWMSNSRGFWTIRGTEVFFDGKPANLPSTYKEVTKKRVVNGVKTESTISVTRDPIEVIEDAFLPKFKASKTMRVKFASGVGPTFDLRGMKTKIEQLEKQCVAKGAAE